MNIERCGGFDCFSRLFKILILVSALIMPAAVTGAPVAVSFSSALTNPAPTVHLSFGYGLAGVAGDRILVGATDDANRAGRAYLFHVDGTLLSSFTNPFSADGDYFGVAVAAMGSETVIIGAPFQGSDVARAGAAYLFGTDGSFHRSFTNPVAPGTTHFGISLTAVSHDKVLIGANAESTGAPFSGTAYLFHTNGTLLHVLTNPTPEFNDSFGIASAANAAMFFIGAQGDANSGAVHLYATNGVFLMTITNPQPSLAPFFGNAVAALGNEHILVGASGGAGAAYLFHTNGSLLTTFTNPAGIEDWFGYGVSALGGDKLVVTAFGAFTPEGKGAAYLFSTNGALLSTWKNPNPTFNDRFGYGLTTLGTDRIIVGAPLDDTFSPGAGAAYVFALSTSPGAALTIEQLPIGTVRLSWPTISGNFWLEQTADLSPTNQWTLIPPPYGTNGERIWIDAHSEDRRFYRLRSP